MHYNVLTTVVHVWRQRRSGAAEDSGSFGLSFCAVSLWFWQDSEGASCLVPESFILGYVFALCIVLLNKTHPKVRGLLS